MVRELKSIRVIPSQAKMKSASGLVDVQISMNDLSLTAPSQKKEVAILLASPALSNATTTSFPASLLVVGTRVSVYIINLLKVVQIVGLYSFFIENSVRPYNFLGW